MSFIHIMQLAIEGVQLMPWSSSARSTPSTPRRAQPFGTVAGVFVAMWVAAVQAEAEHPSIPDPGAVEGEVLRADEGTPVPGVRVELHGEDPSAVTGQDGRFRLEEVPAGDHILVATRIGMGEARKDVNVPAGETLWVELELDDEAVAVDPIAVLSERVSLVGDVGGGVEVPGSAYRVGTREVETGRLATDNPHNVLRQVPGVNVRDEEGYGLRPHIGLRGVGNERASNVTVMEDGVLAAPAPYAAPAAYYFPPMGRMEAVEVRMGSSQIRYGPRTLGGALNLVASPIPEGRLWSVEAGGGTDAMGRIRARAGDGDGRVGWMVETYQQRSDGFKELDGGGETGFRTSDALGRLRVRGGEDGPLAHQLELKAGWHDHRSDETYLGLTDDDFSRDPVRRYPGSQEDVLDTRHRQFQARYMASWEERVEAVVTAYRRDFTRSWYKLHSVLGTDLGPVFGSPSSHSDALAILKGADSEDGALTVRDNNRSYLSQGVEGILAFRFGTGDWEHDLEVGLRRHRDHEDRFQHEDGYRMEAGRMALTHPGAPGSQANRVSRAEAWAGFVQNRIERGALTLVPGVRWERARFQRVAYELEDEVRGAPADARTNQVSAFIPGVGMTYALTGNVHLFGGVHRGFGPPGAGADDETEPERSVNYEVGTRARSGGTSLQVTAFWSDYDNILGESTLATGAEGDGDLFNGGAVEAWGTELTGTWDPLWGRWDTLSMPVRASYTFNRARFLTSFESDHGPWGEVEAGDRLPYLPAHTYHASVGVEGNDAGLTLTAQGNSRMRTEAGRAAADPGREVDGFATLSLSARYDLPQWDTSIRLTVENLTDARYVASRRPAGARPGLPRTLALEVRLGTW